MSAEPFSPEWRRDPYPGYRALRERAPVYWSERLDAHCVTRFDHVIEVLKDADTFSSKARLKRGRPSILELVRNLGPLIKLLMSGGEMMLRPDRSRMLINEDGDVHRAMRDLVRKGFTPRRVAVWEERAQKIVSERIAALELRPEFDLVEEVHTPLPVTIIAAMLGIDLERVADFKRWSDVIIEAGTGSNQGNPLNRPMIETLTEMRRYLMPIARARRADPEDDLISVLVDPREGDVALTDREIFMFTLMLLVAGNETTTNLLSNAVRALYRNPDQLAVVVSDPSKINGLIEETLRYDSPVQILTRKATRDVELAGVHIAEGTLVVPVLGAANRDPDRFPDPDRFDLDRDTVGHLGLGIGAHFCLGASLARLEARVALQSIVPRLPDWQPAEEPAEYIDSYFVRGLRKLRVRPV